MTQGQVSSKADGYAECRIPREGGSVYVRDYAGEMPAFVLLHGFPDNGQIYDLLVPHLVAAGRRVVTLDFLGFGASDKPAATAYSFEQQLADVEAIVEALGLSSVIPVGHDAGGPAAINYSLKHPAITCAVVLLNAFYGDAPGLRMPEFIELFANKNLRALHLQFMKSPEQFGWLLNFQRAQMQIGLTEDQKFRYADFLGPLIDANFRQKPSSLPAFVQMTRHLHDEIASNTSRLVELRQSTVPLKLIWGSADPYLHVSAARYMQAQSLNAELHAIEAGHWPQIDEPHQVAQLMLSI